jgi:uncharacterized protein (DUF885 family)
MKTRSSKLAFPSLLLVIAAWSVETWCLTPLQAAAPDSSPGHAQLTALINAEWEYALKTHPEGATMIGDNRYNDRLQDFSPAAFARRAEHDRKSLAELHAVDPNGLSKEDQLNRMLLVRALQTRVDGARFKDWEMPVNQMNGPHLEYAGIAKEVPLKTVRDYENYLSRLRLLPQVLSEITEDMRLGLKDGLMPPRYLLEAVAVEAQDVATTPLDKSLFTSPLLKFPDDFSEADRSRLTASIRQVVSKQVLPAYSTFAGFVKTDYAPHGRVEYGAWSLPDGEARYRQAIREMTTTDMDPATLHDLGLKQVAAIEKQMLEIANRMGYTDLQSFNAHIFKDPKLHGTSGEQILGLYARYTDQMYAKLPRYFGRLPKNKLSVVPMETYRSANGVPADYSVGAGDGSRPGRINVNEYEPTKRLLLNVEAIAYHEGIPGHHLQFSIAQELTDIPPFRKYAEYNAYSEGWALYSETLAHEMGFYQDPYSEYGRLQNLMWRSIRLVVDTGVHSQHWSRQQMIDFFHQHSAMDDQNIITEVDRYIAWPGQALGYKLGEMTILRLRERARKQLGAKFDIRAFHDAVLGSGPLPLDVLETTVDQWIATQVAKGG